MSCVIKHLSLVDALQSLVNYQYREEHAEEYDLVCKIMAETFKKINAMERQLQVCLCRVFFVCLFCFLIRAVCHFVGFKMVCSAKLYFSVIMLFLLAPESRNNFCTLLLLSIFTLSHYITNSQDAAEIATN